MGICYLCGLELVKFDCSGLSIDQITEGKKKLKSEGKTITHEEHILQNALCGYLKSEDVLCLECGDKLNNSVDKKFTEYFVFVTRLLDTRIDRKSTSKNDRVEANIKHDRFEGLIKVYWSDEGIRPTKPILSIDKENKKIYYYGYSNACDSLISKKKKLNVSEFEIIKNETIPLSEIIVLFPKFELNNLVFKKALAKIAAGFATKEGIERKYLNKIIDPKKNEIYETLFVAPFFPFSTLDKIMEETKWKFRDYPHHYLILFSIDVNGVKSLYCYIELFSTFQWYILISDNYEGPSVFKTFAQKILFEKYEDIDIDYKEEEYYFNLLCFYGYKLEFDQYMKLDYDERKKKINNLLKSTRYDFEYEKYLNDLFTHIVDVSKTKDVDFFTKLTKDVQFLYNGDHVNLKKYKVSLLTDTLKNRIGYYLNLSDSLLRVSHDDFYTRLTVYNYTKFFQLLNFIKQKHGINDSLSDIK